MRILPRDEKFYDLFTELAKRLTGSASMLRELFQNPGELDSKVSAIKGLEHEADNITHDLIDGTARRAQIFRIQKIRPAAGVLAEVLSRAGCVVEDGVRRMKDAKYVYAISEQLKTLEEEGDAVYHEAMGKLFAEGGDALEVVKWKDLYDKIEDALDKCEDVGNVLQSIALKNA